MYQEYQGFKYSLLEEGKWQVTLPSGIRTLIESADEDELKSKIDTAIAEAAEEG